MLNKQTATKIRLQARREGKAVFYRTRAITYRSDADLAYAHGAFKAAGKLARLAEADEATVDKLNTE